MQVKTNARTFTHWLVGKHAHTLASPSHVYALVNIRRRKDLEELEYFIVPSRVVARNIKMFGRRPSPLYAFLRRTAEPYRDKWTLFGTSGP